MQWWAAQRTAQGQSVCGDDFIVVESGAPLVALADGLGHGEAALAAARGFCRVAERFASEELTSLMRRGAEAVHGTRGAAAALLRIDEQHQTGAFVGVGNIDLRATSPHISVASRPGIVGSRLPKLVIHRFRFSPGDVIVMFSDGVSSRVCLSDFAAFAPCTWPEKLLDQHGKPADDMTCVVVQCGGPVS